jgi:hypothetical protein
MRNLHPNPQDPESCRVTFFFFTFASGESMLCCWLCIAVRRSYICSCAPLGGGLRDLRLYLLHAHARTHTHTHYPHMPHTLTHSPCDAGVLHPRTTNAQAIPVDEVFKQARGGGFNEAGPHQARNDARTGPPRRQGA